MSSLAMVFWLGPTGVKIVVRALLKVVTCVWICRCAIACCVSMLGWAGCEAGRCSAGFLAGFFLLVSTLMVGSVPGALGAACGVSEAGGGAGVWAEPAPPMQQSAELLRTSARTMRLDMPTPISCRGP